MPDRRADTHHGSGASRTFDRIPAAGLSRSAAFVSIAATLLIAGLLWSGTIRNDATPYGDGSRIIPWLDFVAGQQGLPVWQPFRNGGFPFFADPEQFWYLVPFVDPASDTANLQLNLALYAMLLMTTAAAWVLARSIGLDPVWSAVSALLIGFSEQAIVAEQSGRFLYFLSMISLLVLLAVLARGRRGPLQYAVMIACTGVALAVGLQYAAVDALAIFASFLWLEGTGWRVSARKILIAAGKTFLIGVAALLLAAIVILPHLGHAREAYISLAAIRYEPVLPKGPAAILRLLFPFVPSDLPMYLGLPALLALGLAATRGFPGPAHALARLFALIGLFAIVFTLMCLPIIGPPIASLYASLPILSTLRQFITAAMVLTLIAALFAGLVFQHYAHDLIATIGRSARTVLAGLLAISASTALFFGTSITMLGAIIFATGSFVAAAYLAWTALGGWRAGVIEETSLGAAGLVSVALSALAIAPVAFLEVAPGRKVELHVDNRPQLHELVKIVQNSSEAERRAQSDVSGLLPLNNAMRNGAGFSLHFPIGQAYTFAYLSPDFDLSIQRPHWLRPVDCTSLDPAALDLLSITYLFCRKHKLAPGTVGGFVAVSEQDGIVLLRRAATHPTGLRVFCRHRATPRLVPEKARGDVLAAFGRGELLLESELESVAAGEPCPEGPAPFAGNVRSTVSTNSSLIEAEAPHSGLLLVPDNYSSHWRAKVNGREVVLARAYFAYVGVPVEKGANRIELWFEDPYVHWGLWISGLTALAVLGLALVPARRPHQAG